MANNALQSTSWIWVSGDGVLGLSIDPETAVLHWYEEIGCHCTDEDGFEQTVARYRQEGVPLMYRPLPDDIRAEVEQLLATL